MKDFMMEEQHIITSVKRILDVFVRLFCCCPAEHEVTSPFKSRKLSRHRMSKQN